MWIRDEQGAKSEVYMTTLLLKEKDNPNIPKQIRDWLNTKKPQGRLSFSANRNLLRGGYDVTITLETKEQKPKTKKEKKPKTIECVADTLQSALKKAETKLPTNADIIEKKLIPSALRVVTVEGVDEENARAKAKRAKRKTESIGAITLEKEGKKGFLGLGKKPNAYKVRLIEPAAVRIKYQIANKEEMASINRSLLKEALRDESAFVRENAALDIAEAVKLGHLSEAEACTYLCPLLEKDPEDSVREFTVGAMWRVIGDKSARKSLCKAIISDSSRILRLLGLSCLKSYHDMGGRDKETLECMIRAGCNDEDLRVRRFAQSCLKMYLILCLDQLSLAEKEQIESACQDLPYGFRESMDSAILMLMNALYAGPISDGRITESTLPLERVREKRESLKDAVPALIEGLQMDIRKSALEVLQIVTGRDFGENQTQWREWWEQNKH